jgi:hypothetical protein
MKIKVKVIVWLLTFGFILGWLTSKDGWSFCYFSECIKECIKERIRKEEKKKREFYSIEYSNPVFLDVENLYRNRTIYVVLVNFKVGEGVEKEVREALIEELKKVGMNVVADPRRGAYLMGLFLRKFNEREIEVDVLIRERYEIKGSEGRVKFYTSDLDSIDHFTTVRVIRIRGNEEPEENMLFKKLIENLVNFFKIY